MPADDKVEVVGKHDKKSGVVDSASAGSGSLKEDEWWDVLQYLAVQVRVYRSY